MKSSRITDILSCGLELSGLKLPPDAYAKFEKYYTFLHEKSKYVNLTAISGVEDVARLHFLDSIMLLGVYRFHGARVIDIGSGAGFPGVPLKISEPSIDLTLLDATVKRIDFLSELCSVLGVCSAFICARAEEASCKEEIREKYDIAVSRAVARLNILCELCLPYVCPGGVFIAMKTIDSDDEISEANNAILSLGGQLIESIDYLIPETSIRRRAVIISKTKNTPADFPRRYSKMQRNPL